MPGRIRRPSWAGFAAPAGHHMILKELDLRQMTTVGFCQLLQLCFFWRGLSLTGVPRNFSGPRLGFVLLWRASRGWSRGVWRSAHRFEGAGPHLQNPTNPDESRQRQAPSQHVFQPAPFSIKLAPPPRGVLALKKFPNLEESIRQTFFFQVTPLKTRSLQRWTPPLALSQGRGPQRRRRRGAPGLP